MTPALAKGVLVGLAVAAVLAALLFAVVARACRETSDVPVLHTWKWAPYDEEEVERELRRNPGRAHTSTPRPHADIQDVLLRRESAGGGALLLKHPAREAVYRYDPAAKTLGAVTDEEWRRAAGPVAECGKQLPPFSLDIRVDPDSQRLTARGRAVATAGRYALGVTASPSGRWAAVLSAAGPKVPTAMPFPFFPNHSVEGQHYLELMSLPDLAPRGKPIRISRKAACWAADEQFVVLLDGQLTSLSVVETGLPTASPP